MVREFNVGTRRAVSLRVDTNKLLKCIGISKLGLKGRQDIAGGEAPCKDIKIIQAPKGRQDVLFSCSKQ